MNLDEKTIKELNECSGLVSFIPTWQAKKFLTCSQKTTALFTGNQCISGDSKIYDPILNKELVVQDINHTFHVMAWDGKEMVITEAEMPFRKEIDDLYTIRLSNGQEFVASLSHRVLTPSGYKKISDVPVGSELFIPQSNSESYQLVHLEDDQNYGDIVLSSQSCYQKDFYLYDEQPLSSLTAGSDISPSPNDVPVHKEFHSFVCWDGQENKSKHTHICQCNDHLSNQDVQNQNVGHVSETLSYNACKHQKLPYLYDQVESQPTYECAFQPQSNDVFSQQANQPCSNVALNISHNRLLVTSITHNRRDYKWDFTVPKYHNYQLAGVIHHNSMKTATSAYAYVLRVLGRHPIPKKNIVYWECQDRMKAKLDDEFKPEYLSKHESLDSATWNFMKTPKDGKCPECSANTIIHKRDSRVMRFCSDSLPGESSNINFEGVSAEVKNTQYPEFKKWLPPFLIKKDITHRRPTMIIKDIWGGNDIIVEFVSYNQSVQSTAGHQRVSIWLDEQPPPAFYEEQRPRLLKEDGDIVISCTPADRISYLYDEVFEKASIYYRTKAICERYKCEQIEKTDSTADIAVIQAATDDNPVLSSDDISSLLDEWADDPDKLDIRRYGIFKQVSGRIYKHFDWNTHVIPKDKYFPDGIPHENWNHFRGVDYHEHVNLACGWMSISPQNEAFIWEEFNPSPETMVTFEIAKEMCLKSKDYKFLLNLEDPLANKTQTNTGMTVMEDMNRAFMMYKKEGIGTGGYWQAWDTKSTRGRDEMRKRVKNSVQCGKPFNNLVIKNGKKVYLPTIWVLDNCRITAKSMKNWRLEEWTNNAQNAMKDKKETPQQRYSHFNMIWECLFKHPAVRPKAGLSLMPKEFRQERFKGDVHATA